MDIKAIEMIINKLPTTETLLIDDNARQSSVMIPIVQKEGELFLLFEKRSQKVSQPGEICFPGGRKDQADESYEVTAIREMEEEIGVHRDDIIVLGKMGILAGSHRSVIHCYIGLMQWDVINQARYNHDEVEEIMLVSLDVLKKSQVETYSVHVKAYGYEHDDDKTTLFPAKDLELPEIYHDKWSMGYRNIYVYNLENIQIWGLTGQLVKYFLEKIME